jgi:hypothetical protein
MGRSVAARCAYLSSFAVPASSVSEQERLGFEQPVQPGRNVVRRIGSRRDLDVRAGAGGCPRIGPNLQFARRRRLVLGRSILRTSTSTWRRRERTGGPRRGEAGSQCNSRHGTGQPGSNGGAAIRIEPMQRRTSRTEKDSEFRCPCLGRPILGIQARHRERRAVGTSAVTVWRPQYRRLCGREQFVRWQHNQRSPARCGGQERRSPRKLLRLTDRQSGPQTSLGLSHIPTRCATPGHCSRLGARLGSAHVTRRLAVRSVRYALVAVKSRTPGALL